MAKDLPYFKFFVSEWNDGDITLESFEHQGVFINICSYYWSKECNLSFDKLIKRFSTSIDIIDDLSAESIIKIDENRMLRISFLDEQFEERETTSKKNSAAGKASAEKRRLVKLQQESNTNPTSVEITLNGKSTIKRREEKKREEDIIPDISTFMLYLKDYLNKEPQRYEKVRTRMIDTYNAWKLNNWKDGNDKKIKNWKTKALMQLRYIK